jgi:8-oxo-dGTP pyrophosphatase MutT (NUDIX family)
VETAIRETREEVGIQLTRAHLVGGLDPVVPQTRSLPPIAIWPFVFLLPDRPCLTLNSEVASASWVEVDQLLQPTTHGPVRLKLGGDVRLVDAYQVEPGVVWGITERILTALLNGLQSTG